MVWLLLLGVVEAAEPAWATLLSEDGWESLGTPSTKETGPIDLRLKTIGGDPCLRGEVTVSWRAEVLMDVVTDFKGAPQITSETLIASRLLGNKGGVLEYYQHLDVPNWTMASDRFWVLRGQRVTEGPTVSFRWNRFEWRTAYPDLAKQLDTEHSDAVEPQVNWGQWQFTESPEGTQVRYYICSNPGGSLPEWVQKAAATKTLPNTMADIMREGKKRSQ